MGGNVRCKAYAIERHKPFANLNRHRIRWRGFDAFPGRYQLSFDDNGNERHTAILLDARGNSEYQVRLNEVRGL